jgi:ADP-L-glycero-D-manno-heptose 6-epimerase
MMVVTGAAGFIGSALVAKLNELGEENLLLVDEIGHSPKWKNLLGKKFNDFLHKDDFITRVRNRQLTDEIRAVVHLGACSSTTETDVDFLLENNYRYSQTLAEGCVANDKRFIYASSAATYGDGGFGFSDADAKTQLLRPMNPYGWSKQLFDLWILRRGLESACVGLKFFNVFGPNEYHKGDMASVVYKAYHQILETGQLRLFKSHRADYADGEQKRDFVYIKDCVEVLVWLLDHPEVNGIFNLGTGQARSWNDLAKAIFSAMKKPLKVVYFDMPENIRTAYQYFTQAEMKKLRAAGYSSAFRSLEDAVQDYVVNYLTPGYAY